MNNSDINDYELQCASCRSFTSKLKDYPTINKPHVLTAFDECGIATKQCPLCGACPICGRPIQK